jgi:hypothetical protein
VIVEWWYASTFLGTVVISDLMMKQGKQLQSGKQSRSRFAELQEPPALKLEIGDCRSGRWSGNLAEVDDGAIESLKHQYLDRRRSPTTINS